MSTKVILPNFSRRAFLAGLACSASSHALAQSQAPQPRPKTLRVAVPSLAEILNRYRSSGDHSVMVIDVQTGRVLEGSNATKNLPPASVTKIATALYGLRTLGSAHRFRTQVIGSGKVVNGELQGNLTLVGGGDPLLDTDQLGGLVQQLRARGISRLRGAFQIYHRALPYQKEIADEQPDHVGYNAAISGLNLNFNRVFFQWKRGDGGYQTSLEAKGKTFAPAVRGIDLSIAARDLPVYQYRSVGGRDRWTVAQGALGRGGSRWLPVRSPANYTAEVFRNIGADLGLALPVPRTVNSIPKGVVLAQANSPELSRVVRDMLKFSNNMTAEIVGMTASKKRKVKKKTIAGSAAAMSSWIRKTYRVEGLKFVDHSGLGSGSRVSAQQMAVLLQRVGWDGPLRAFLKPVALRNADWKLAPIEGASVVAKTGTLNFASALSGYVTCPNGRQLAFAVFSSDLRKRAAIPKDKMDRATGAKSWARQSRILQHQLLRRWALVYGRS